MKMSSLADTFHKLIQEDLIFVRRGVSCSDLMNQLRLLESICTQSRCNLGEPVIDLLKE